MDTNVIRQIRIERDRIRNGQPPLDPKSSAYQAARDLERGKSYPVHGAAPASDPEAQAANDPGRLQRAMTRLCINRGLTPKAATN